MNFGIEVTNYKEETQNLKLSLKINLTLKRYLFFIKINYAALKLT